MTILTNPSNTDETYDTSKKGRPPQWVSLLKKKRKKYKTPPKNKEIITNPSNTKEFYVLGTKGRLPKWLTLCIEKGTIKNPIHKKESKKKYKKRPTSKIAPEDVIIRPKDGYMNHFVWNYIGQDGMPRHEFCVIAQNTDMAFGMISDNSKNYPKNDFEEQWVLSTPSPMRAVIELKGDGIYKYNKNNMIWDKLDK